MKILIKFVKAMYKRFNYKKFIINNLKNKIIFVNL